MAGVRLIALDLDGTLLGPDGDVSDRNRSAIAAALAAGWQVTLATGRHRYGLVQALVTELGLTAPFVVLNGGEVWAGDTLLSRTPFTQVQVQQLLDVMQAAGCFYWAASVSGVFPQDKFPADVASEQWLKFGCYAERPEVLAAVWRQLQALGPYELTQSNSANLEINPPGVSKASGLAVACRVLGLDASQVVAIGDGRNDVPMLRWAGCGIAMGNASKPVQDVAAWVTATCAEDGVACAIERLLSARAEATGP